MAARGDSDGYFCVGPGYLAYQFGMAGPPVAPHRLHIVRYGDGRIAEPVVFLLPQFQVHGMRCREGAVDVAAFDAIHTVGLDSAGLPAGLTSEPLAERGRLPAWTVRTGNLTRLSQAASTMTPERHSLLGDANGHEFVLLLTPVADSVRECPPTIIVRILELDRDRREVRARTLFEWDEAPTCTRGSLAPFLDPNQAAPNAADVLLDALVFGVHRRINLNPYSGALRQHFEEYLRRADAYRTTRPPAGIGLMEMVDAARVNYERMLFAVAPGSAVSAAVAYVERLRPCYEWEGFADCPERDARFADAFLREQPTGPFSAYLPLLSAHRWLCAAEGFDYEKKPADSARSQQAAAERLAVARASASILIRTAAETLARRGRCRVDQ